MILVLPFVSKGKFLNTNICEKEESVLSNNYSYMNWRGSEGRTEL